MKRWLSVAVGVLSMITSAHTYAHERTLYCVVLAGGSGTRLWPLSRQDHPKQLLSVDGDVTLLEQAIARVEPLIDQENIWVSTTAQHEKKIRDLVGNRVGRVIVEPGARNTGPAILFTCMEIMQHDPDALIFFVPSDQYVPEKDNQRYRAFMEHAFDHSAQHDTITLFGVQPTFPATGYGYIEYDNRRDSVPYPVMRFREKPSREVAQEYVDAGTMLWNICMFCAQASVFVREFQACVPLMYDAMHAFNAGTISYADIPADSIDYAVLEKSRHVSVLPVNFGWCDVGNISVLLSLQDKTDASTDVVTVDAYNNLVDVPDKLTVLVGVDNVCVVDTGDALLITKRDKAEQVKQAVQHLKKMGSTDYL